MHVHFTDIAISRLKTEGMYYDESTPAFGIRVGKNKKSWFVIRGRERSRKYFGQYPDKKLADARKEAKELLTQTPTKADRTTFSMAYELWKVAIEVRKPRTQKDYRRHIEKYFLPRLKAKRLPDLTFEQIIDCVDGVAPGEANHALAVAHIFLRWCTRPPRRYIAHNPLEGIQIRPSKKRKRVLSEAELKAVWMAAGAMEYPYGTVVRLLIATGQRRGEIAHLRWPWINERDRLITIPSDYAKNSNEHTFPYGELVARILATVPRLNSTDLLFPSRVSNERPFSGFGKFKQQLNAITEGVEPYRLHDLRRTMRTIHGQIGTPSEIGERLINHVAGVTTEVERIYDLHTYIPQMRGAVENYEAHLSQLLAA
jgi:integrase